MVSSTIYNFESDHFPLSRGHIKQIFIAIIIYIMLNRSNKTTSFLIRNELQFVYIKLNKFELRKYWNIFLLLLDFANFFFMQKPESLKIKVKNGSPILINLLYHIRNFSFVFINIFWCCCITILGHSSSQYVFTVKSQV